MINIAFNKDLPFSIFSFLHWDLEGRERLTVLVKGSFLLGENARLIASRDKPEILFEDQFKGEANASSLIQESDLAPFKPKTDISLNAIARTPEAKELASWPVRIDIAGRLSYAFHVTGARFFEPCKNGSKGSKYWAVSDIKKTHLVELDYEHSFGGTVKISEDDVKSYPYNPVGTGLVSDYLLEQDMKVAIAQIGVLAELNDPKPDEEMTVCGIAPIVKSWLPRRSLAGNLDERWLANRHPLMPEDFDFNYWNAAPRPLQAAPYLQGHEMLRLHGLSHDPRPISLILPGAGLGARLFRHNAKSAESLSLQLDTFHGDICSENREDHRFTLIWRATFDRPDDIAEIILHPAALKVAPTQEETKTNDRAGEDRKAQDILQNRKEKNDATLTQSPLSAPTATALTSAIVPMAASPSAPAAQMTATPILTRDSAPLFPVMLVNGKEADFYVQEQENRVFVTQPGTAEIIHIGAKDFIYAAMNNPKSATTNLENPPHMPQKINEKVTLYVRLLKEEVLVWRPVIAHWHGGQRFYITLQSVPAGEIWEFRPNTHVIAQWRHFNEGDYLVAVALSNY